jgi:hypothetical protein
MSAERNYWKECLSIGADECGLTLTPEQLDALAESVEGGHEHYGMAFYSPPASDRIAVLKREEDDRYNRLQCEFDTYRNNAETAVKKALRQDRDAIISIGEYGEVNRHGGRTVQIQ